MALGFLTLLILATTLLVVRGGGPARLTTWSARPTWRAYLGGSAVVLAANAPLAAVAMPFAAIPTFAPGDARSHALVARAIADHGLPHGWTDVYQGGFPVGPHYPTVGWF